MLILGNVEDAHEHCLHKAILMNTHKNIFMEKLQYHQIFTLTHWLSEDKK